MDKSSPHPPPRSLGQILLSLGPGMIIAGSIVGSGELIATTKVGAEAGFWLLWLMVLGCVIKVFVQVEFGRHTLIWSQTPLEALNTLPGPRWKVNWLLWYWAAMTVLVITQQGGIVGGVGQTLAMTWPLTQEGKEYNHRQNDLIQAKVQLALLRTQRPDSSDIPVWQKKIADLAVRNGSSQEPRDPYLWAVLIAAATSVLLYIGRYTLIQTVSTILVAGFTVVTVLTVLLLQTKPEWAIQPSELVQGLRFQLPPRLPDSSINPIATAFGAFGIIGVGAAELIMYPYWCLEKGYARFTGPRQDSPDWLARAKGWLRILHIDAFASMAVYTFVTVAFYWLGAAVLGRARLNPQQTDMIRTLKEMYVPVFGKWSDGVFLFGAFAVLYSTFFVAAAGNSRMVADGLGLFGLHDKSERTRQRWTRWISAVWPLVAVVAYIFVQAPVAMVLASGVAQAIMLPMLGIAALYFRYRKTLQPLRPARIWDVLLWFSFGGFLITGVWSLYSQLQTWFS